MGKDISLFSGYSQKENRTTNYCLLVLRLLYDENPKFLGEVLSALVDEGLSDVVGVHFHQQTRKQESVPDGLIIQRSFTVYIETKNFDWFRGTQLARHLEALAAEPGGSRALIALADFETLGEDRFDEIRSLCAQRYSGSVYFAAATFEDFLGALPRQKVSKNLADTLDDFESYLDDEDLLPRWKNRFDVVNCSRLADEVLHHSVYICPAKGGAYNHKRARFFGLYQEKAVRGVAAIEAVVEPDPDGSFKVRWKNVDRSDDELRARAAEKHEDLRPSSEKGRVFLLGSVYETDFRKGTKGGMQTSKQYFDIGSLEPSDAADLAAKLRGKVWTDLMDS